MYEFIIKKCQFQTDLLPWVPLTNYKLNLNIKVMEFRDGSYIR